MTLYQFNGLDEMEQIEAIWEKGVTIAIREDQEYRYELVQIDGFYVELKRHKFQDVLIKFRTFNTTTLLEPYLGKINIPNAGE